MASTAREEGPREALDPASIPVAFWFGPHAVPDLAELPRDRWVEVIQLTDDRYREKAAGTALALGTEAVAEAMEIVFGLHREAEDRRRRARTATAFCGQGVPGRGTAPPAPDAAAPRQVNFRVSARHHAELLEAAALVGLKPAELARFLTRRGVQQVLAEARPTLDDR